MPIHKTRSTDAEDSQHFFLALSPERFCDVEKFNREIQTTLDKIRALPPLDPEHPVRIPGDRGAADHAEYLQDGIPLPHAVAQEIKDRATTKKVAVNW